MSKPYESSAAPAVVPGSTSLEIRSVGVLSCGKLMGVLYAFLGLIIGAFMTLFSLAGAALSNNGGGAAALGVGAAAIVVIPIMYGIGGFLGGIITGFLYNVVAGVVGGVEINTNLIGRR